ncbi:hypothetical protein BGZ67_004745 [Mortierella alpina]|nr:hypothetical protein BGZ67_004745 [Mortierella alpina]
MDFDVLWHDKATILEDHSRPSKLGKDTVCLDLDTIIKESSIARLSQNPFASKIKLLQLPVCLEDEYDINRKNPLLSCTIPWVSKCATSLDVEKALREYSPNLKHLTYQSSEDEYEDEVEDYEFVRAFIRGCSGLESFTLSNLGSQDPYRPAKLIISDLVSHHYNTLKEIELTDCWRLSGSDQQAILNDAGN